MIITTILLVAMMIGLMRLTITLTWGIAKFIIGILGFIFSPIFLILMLLGTASVDLLALVVIVFLIYAIYCVIQRKPIL